MFDNHPTAVPTHPLGIRPAGNAYTSEYSVKSSAGLFASLPDELLVSALEYLSATSLLCIGSTCKVLYAFSRFEDLWKSLLLE